LFSWVVYEQRLLILAVGALFAASSIVWAMALQLRHKDPVVIRAPPSLKEAAVAFYGAPEVDFDQVALFLSSCLPLLYDIDDSGHSLLPLAEGLVAPDVFGEAGRRLGLVRGNVLAHAMTQTLVLTDLTDLVSDGESRRVAAYVRGTLTVTVRHSEARIFPWRAQVLLEATRASRLNRTPFTLLKCTSKLGPQALAWDSEPRNGMP
jgi:hypothetical protein